MEISMQIAWAGLGEGVPVLEMESYLEIITVQELQDPSPQPYLVPVSQTGRVVIKEKRGT